MGDLFGGLKNPFGGLFKGKSPLEKAINGMPLLDIHEIVKPGGQWNSSSHEWAKEHGLDGVFKTTDKVGPLIAAAFTMGGSSSFGGGEARGATEGMSSVGYENAFDTGAMSSAVNGGSSAASSAGSSASSWKDAVPKQMPSFGGGKPRQGLQAQQETQPEPEGAVCVTAAGRVGTISGGVCVPDADKSGDALREEYGDNAKYYTKAVNSIA